MSIFSHLNLFTNNSVSIASPAVPRDIILVLFTFLLSLDGLLSITDIYMSNPESRLNSG